MKKNLRILSTMTWLFLMTATAVVTSARQEQTASVSSQKSLFIKGYNRTPMGRRTYPGQQVFKTLVINTSSSPVRFYPVSSKLGDALKTDSTLAAYVVEKALALGVAPTDTPAVRVGILKVIINRVEKTCLFQNSLHTWSDISSTSHDPSSDEDSMRSKKYSAISSMAIFNEQCGGYAYRTMAIAVLTGYFTWADFWGVSMHRHSCGRAFIGMVNTTSGSDSCYAFFDSDPGQYFGPLFAKPAGSACGYYDIGDLESNHGILNIPFYYLNESGDTIDKNPQSLLADYQSRFDSIQLYRVKPVQPYPLKREIIIGPGDTLEFSYTEKLYRIDTATKGGTDSLALALMYYTSFVATQNPIYYDSLITVGMSIFGVTHAVADSLFRFNLIRVYKSTSWTQEYSCQVPVVSYNAAAARTVGIDIAFPGICIFAKCARGTIGQVAFTDSVRFMPWSKTSTEGDPVPIISSDTLNFMASPGTGSLNGPGLVQIAYGPTDINPYQGMVFEGDSSLSALKIERYDGGIRQVDTVSGIADISHTDQLQIKVYPNPSAASSDVTFVVPVTGMYRVISVLGEEVGSFEIRTGPSVITMPTPATKGLYLLVGPNVTARFIVQ